MANIQFKLYIDDIREAPDGWVLARNISTAINFIERYNVNITAVSFDHDISIPVRVEGKTYNRPSPDTFLPVAKFLGMTANLHNNFKVECTTHSANPDGRKLIVRALREYGLDCKENPLPKAEIE